MHQNFGGTETKFWAVNEAQLSFKATHLSVSTLARACVHILGMKFKKEIK
jgi:hypothetical protein